MPEPSVYPSLIALPTAPRRSQPPNVDKDLTTITLWAADLQRAIANQFNAISRPLREGKLTPGPHAPQHRPDTGTDPLDTAAPSGGYGNTSALGSGGNLLRADARFEWPEALGALLDRSKKVTLTDSGFGATLTASGAFGVSQFALQAPGSAAVDLDAGASTPLVVLPGGQMGRGNASATALMQHAGVT